MSFGCKISLHILRQYVHSLIKYSFPFCVTLGTAHALCDVNSIVTTLDQSENEDGVNDRFIARCNAIKTSFIIIEVDNM